MIDMTQFGYTGPDAPEGLPVARIIEEQRDLYRVVCGRGETAARLTGAFMHGAADRSDYPAVGDFVLLKYNESGDSGIVRLLARRTKFSRTDFSGHAAGYAKTVLEQVVAANFDYVFIVSSLNRDFRINRIARYLTQTAQSGGAPVVILTKADLCPDPSAQISAVAEIAPGVPIIALSSHTGEGLDRLNEYLAPGKTLVFLGMSGVGKSSLLNALAGEELMPVRGIREDDARGRHTTTHRELFRLPGGAMVIDTPGMRELGLWDAQEGIDASFASVEELAARCRFSDCRHETEPGCAVRAALLDGSLSRVQWESYLAQKREMTFVQRKAKLQKAGKWGTPRDKY